MTPAEFVAKWTGVELSERAAGQWFTFEKAVKAVGAASKGSKGDSGFVDVWKKGFFGWEYKRKDKYKNLDEAYRQLYQYRDALLNPPLSVVCDIRTLEIRTYFPGYTNRAVVRLS